MKKLFIIIPLLLIIVVFIVIGIITNNNLKYEIEEVSEYNYFKLYKDGKYGVIDKFGTIIVNPEYEIVYIPNPSKSVFVCYYDYNEESGDYKTKILNEKSNLIFSEFNNVEAFIFKDTNMSKIPFEKSVLKYRQNGKYGLIDFDGNKITENIYDSIENLEYKEGTFVVEKEGKYGVINLKGNTLVNIEFNKIEADGYFDEETKSYKAGFIVAKKIDEGYKYGYINSDGKQVLKNEYSEVYRVTDIDNKKGIYLIAYKNGKAGLLENQRKILDFEYDDIEYNKVSDLFAVKKSLKQGVFDKTGKKIIDIEYETILFSESSINANNGETITIFDLNGNDKNDNEYTNIYKTGNENYDITINKNGKYGVKDKNGNVIIKNNYQYIEYAYSKYFIVTNEGKIGILNDEGKSEVDFIYDIIQKIDNTNVMQAINFSENTIDIYDINAKKTVSVKNAYIYMEKDYIKILSDTERKYIDNNGKEISNKEIYLQNDLFASLKDGKWGFTNVDGKVIVDYKYDMVTELNKYGFAGIKQNNLWGVIDRNGNIIVEPSYKIDEKEPEFIDKYCRQNYGYGFEYYTEDLK